MKKCSRCGEFKKLNTSNFGKRKISKDGYYGQCIKCRSAVKKNRLERVGNIIVSTGETMSSYNRRYYEDNKKAIAKRQREQRQENKQEILNRNRDYRKNNPHIYVKARQNWRARQRKLPYTLTTSEWEDILKHFDYKCSYCGISEADSLLKYNERLHQEHFIPLTKGGEYTHNNIIPSCKSCNSNKSNKDFFKWYKHYKHYSKERERYILEYLGYENKTQQLSIL